MNDFVLAQHGLALSPRHPLALQMMGNAYVRQEQINEAIPYLLDADDAQQGNVDTMYSLAVCYSEINALPLAEQYLTRAILLNGLEPRTHLLLGTVRFRQNRLDEAESEIRHGIELQHSRRKALRLGPISTPLFSGRADAQGAMGDYLFRLRNEPVN